MTEETFGEGSIVEIPVEGSHVLAVVARTAFEAGVALLYLFSPAIVRGSLSPVAALGAVRTGLQSLQDGRWRVVGSVEDWRSSDWPVPEFVREDPIRRKRWRVRYAEHDLLTPLNEATLSDEEPAGLTDRVYGVDALEKMISRVLAGRARF